MYVCSVYIYIYVCVCPRLAVMIDAGFIGLEDLLVRQDECNRICFVNNQYHDLCSSPRSLAIISLVLFGELM